MSTPTERVQAGIAFLDASPLVPSDWREHINPDRLSVVSVEVCPLAQLAMAYRWHTEAWSPWVGALDHLWPSGASTDELQRLGFVILPSVWDEETETRVPQDAPEDGDTPGPTTLTAAWREALRKTTAV